MLIQLVYTKAQLGAQHKVDMGVTMMSKVDTVPALTLAQAKVKQPVPLWCPSPAPFLLPTGCDVDIIPEAAVSDKEGGKMRWKDTGLDDHGAASAPG